MAALALLGLLRFSPVPSVVGAFAYVLSPYVITTLINPVFLAGLLLLAALPAVVLAVSARRVSTRAGIVLLGFSAPMVGYV
jgi:hypothetical protein